MHPSKMFVKYLLIILFFFLSHLIKAQRTISSTENGFKNFLSGNWSESVQFYSQAIVQDSLCYENYYLRGITMAYMSDTLNCLNDFFKAIEIKRKYNRTLNDTLINGIVAMKPTRSSRLCDLSLSNQSDSFFLIWRGVWFLLNNNSKGEACTNFVEAEQNGVKQLSKYSRKYCK